MAKIKKARVKVSFSKEERLEIDKAIERELEPIITELVGRFKPELPAEFVDDATIANEVTEATSLLICRSIRRALKNGGEDEEE